MAAWQNMRLWDKRNKNAAHKMKWWTSLHSRLEKGAGGDENISKQDRKL
jgi:hypothetical protein